MEVYREDGELDAECLVGVIGKDGPLYISPEAGVDPTMVRFLVNLVQASIPLPSILPDPVSERNDVRQTLGFGLVRRKKDDLLRRSSWTNLNWVPGIPRGFSPAPNRTVPAEIGGASAKEMPPRWPSLGLGGLGEAMGNMGTVLGLGSSPRSEKGAHMPKSVEQSKAFRTSSEVQVQPADSDERSFDRNHDQQQREDVAEADSPGDTAENGEPIIHHVEQSFVALPDLRAAVQVDSEFDLIWDGRGVWIRTSTDATEYGKRRLSWTIVRTRVNIAARLPSSHLS